MSPSPTRYYGADYLHFITTSCYQRRPLLGSPQRRDLFLESFEDMRRLYRFVVVGYVVMPEHVHLLIGEPERGNPSVVMQAIKQSFAQRVKRLEKSVQPMILGPVSMNGLPHPARFSQGGSAVPERGPVWLKRFYDFPIWNPHKRPEKLNYMHLNPVRRGLVSEPEQWPWSSFRFYTLGEAGPVLLNEQKPARMRVREGSPVAKIYETG